MKTAIEIVKERFPYSNTNSLYERYEVVQLIEDCIAQLQQPRLTDEQIDVMFPDTEYGYPIEIIQRQAARQVRDLLQGKGGQGV